jgi:hypothetical protein
MSKIKTNFTKCPACGREGQPLDNNPMVWYHTLETGSTARPSFQKHKWSVQTGRMVHTKPDTEDEIW